MLPYLKAFHNNNLEKIKSEKEKQTLIFYSVCLMLLAFTALIFFAYTKVKLKRKHENTIQEKQISEHKLMALRAQMNEM